MGIGRLEFLRLTGIALAGLAIDPLNAVAINDDVYVNRKLGILFEKPSNWGFLAVKDFGKIKSEQVIGARLDITAEEFWEDFGDPICIATKYYEDIPEYKGIFSPTITLNITHKSELDFIDHENHEELMRMSELGVSLILNDFKVVKRYEPTLINNCKFFEYDFNCHQSKEQNQIADKEFEKFKRSIKLI